MQSSSILAVCTRRLVSISLQRTDCISIIGLFLLEVQKHSSKTAGDQCLVDHPTKKVWVAYRKTIGKPEENHRKMVV